MVRSTIEIDEQIELLNGYESSESIVDSLKQKKKLLFLLSEDEYKEPVSNWAENMYDATKLDECFYFSIAKCPLPFVEDM